MDAPVQERRLRADAARNRARILAAAREVFAARGLDATLDDIARHAGLGTGTVYRRFPDRDALVEALFEERIAEVAALADRCLRDEDPWHGLVTLLRTACEQMAEDRGLRQVLLGSSYGQERVARARDRVLPLVQQVVARAQAAGALRPEFSAADVPVLFLMIGTVSDFGGDAASGLWRRWFTYVVDGLRATGGPEADLPAPLCAEGMAQAMACWRPSGRRAAAP